MTTSTGLDTPGTQVEGCLDDARLVRSVRSQVGRFSMEDVEQYLGGAKLYGDDFDRKQLEEWYEDERNGYAHLVVSKERPKGYTSHLKNLRYGYRFLPRKKYANVLGFGGADGSEFLPILPLLGEIVIIEPTEAFVRSRIGNVPLTYVKPSMDGLLPFGDNTFDLATSFGALHHVANVSQVVKELARCLRPGGFLLIEEPTVSMGDWRKPREGLTKRERGIPLNIFRRIVQRAGLEIIRERRILFSATGKLGGLLHVPLWTFEVPLFVDEILCRLFYWNTRYHPRNLVEWLMPTNVFYVLRKPHEGLRHLSDLN